MKKRIADLSREEQDKVRAYNREQKRCSREKQKASGYVPTADEWTWNWNDRFPEQAAEAREHVKEVQRKVAPNQWWMRKDDGPFLYQGCPDFPNERVIWAGYIARKIRYEERGNCKSILRSDLGFWWDRDADGNAKR